MKGSRKDAKPERPHRMVNRVTFFEVEILDPTRLQLCFLDKVEPSATIGEIKYLLHKIYPKQYPSRQSLTPQPNGRSLRDEEVLESLPVGTTATMFFHDLGPQVGWTMVFLKESIGPLLVYLLFYFRLCCFYQNDKFTASPLQAVKLACACHSFHYIKKMFEIVFIHRFSHGTMALKTSMRNCLYYWGFAAWLAYHINHPLYTPPSFDNLQVYGALVMFMICEAGSFSINLALSQMGCIGSRPKRIPYPTKNPFTWLFFFVSCPNYTYEVGSWISFSIMTQCVPVALFTTIRFIQMTIWAREKHAIYTGEFISYPELRTAIIPLFI